MSKNEFSFLDHLEELRLRIIYVVIIFVVIFLISLSQSQKILEWIKNNSISLIFIHPAEVLLVRLKLAFYSAMILCYPVALYQLFKFIQSAIFKVKQAVLFLFLSLCLFISCIFVYKFFVFPYILKFLIKFTIPEILPQITVNNYVSVFFTLFLILVILFQLPVVIVGGVCVGIINLEFLRHRRREIYLLSFIVSAVLTPPDVLSQLLLALPLIVLLELSILISRFCVYNNKKQGR